MRDETKMDVYTSGVTGAEYDAGMKQLMSNKEILVPILQMTVPEFKTCSQEEILECLDISSITKDDFVSDIPDIEKDLRLTKEDSELSSLVEKLVRFDIRFKIINPKLSTEKIRVNLHIDMEAQKSYRPSNPSYPILKRAVYYVARGPFLPAKYDYTDHGLFKIGEMLFHMDLCGGCAKETAKYIDGIFFFEEGYHRSSR